MKAIQLIGNLRRWITFLVLVALVLGATFLIVTAYFPGETYMDRLQAAYVVLWTNTTQKEFTDIMRENAWVYVVPAAGIILVSGWQLPRIYWGRAIFAYIVFGIGFVGGHVFW